LAKARGGAKGGMTGAGGAGIGAWLKTGGGTKGGVTGAGCTGIGVRGT